MRVVIVPDENSVAKKAYEIIRDRMNNWKVNVMGFATGSTPLKLYREMIAGFQRGELDFSGVNTFNLDEYLGLSDDHEQSYRRFMDENLFNHVNLDPQNVHFLYGLTDDIEAECATYEEDMDYLGGIKLQILGLGRDGHIGFNEPGSSLESRTGLVTIAPETIQDNARFFRSAEEVPRWALSMGIGTIMDCEECLLLATGPNKADAVAAMVEGPLSASCPASALQGHNCCTVILDEPAAAKLKRADYYKNVENLSGLVGDYLLRARRRAGLE